MEGLQISCDLVGVVVIGRNEGERLKLCLSSLNNDVKRIIYVDSGSTDGSIEYAKSFGVDVINLDIDIPFTAARARNEGFEKLTRLYPNLEYVQFVDGDCEIVEGWISKAIDYMQNNKNVAVVCGRRRERYPEASIYNMLCDIEWNTPIGESKSCGGDSLMRINALSKVNGFNSSVIAGEEPELCLRLRQIGYKIWRLDYDMTLHDANIVNFKQWWKRMVRTGYAFTLGKKMHGKSREKYRAREVRRIIVWGALIPIISLLGGFINLHVYWLLILYPLQVARLALINHRKIPHKWSYTIYLVIGKFAEFQGFLKYHINRFTGKETAIIEYK